MLNIECLEKSLEVVFPLHFVYGFSKKVFFMLYPINWPNFIASFSLLLEIFGNMSICFVNWDVIKFEINLVFLITPFFSAWQKKYLEKEKSF